MRVDLERLAAAAADSFLRDGEAPSSGTRGGTRGDRPGDRHRLRAVGAVTIGIGVGLAGRAVLRRVRDLDLEQVAEAIESRLEGQ